METPHRSQASWTVQQSSTAFIKNATLGVLKILFLPMIDIAHAMTDRTLAGRLLALREEAKLSRAELAGRSGIDANLIYRIESLSTMMSVAVLCRLAFALNTRPSALFDTIEPVSTMKRARATEGLAFARAFIAIQKKSERRQLFLLVRELSTSLPRD